LLPAGFSLESSFSVAERLSFADRCRAFRMQWNPIDLLLHLNDHLDALALQIGGWIYLLLFLIVFCESGLVVTPFLPGDALLFTVGALTATTKHLELWVVLILLPIAAFLGYTLNYWLGAAFGRTLFKRDDSRVFNRKYLQQSHAFYDRHGGKTIALARYLPVIRTFAPFVAGMASMNYPKFFLYNLLGGIFWVFSVVLIGHFFGGLPYVQHNFSLVILAVIVVSMIPPGIEFLRAWLGRSEADKTAARD
jgi:membrane-associated protein